MSLAQEFAWWAGAPERMVINEVHCGFLVTRYGEGPQGAVYVRSAEYITVL